jgi:hypothetical protein
MREGEHERGTSEKREDFNDGGEKPWRGTVGRAHLLDARVVRWYRCWLSSASRPQPGLATGERGPLVRTHVQATVLLPCRLNRKTLLICSEGR